MVRSSRRAPGAGISAEVIEVDVGKPKKLGARAAAAARKSVHTSGPDLVPADLPAPTSRPQTLKTSTPARAPEAEGRLRRLIDDAESRHLDPVERIAAVREARLLLEDLELAAWRAGRRQGMSWLQMATPLGITRSAAQQRLGALEARRGKR